MGNSLLLVGARMGMDVRLARRSRLWPAEAVVARARALAKESGAKITLTDDPKKGVKGCDFVHTDVWVSMGEPAEKWAERIKLLKKYRVTAALMKATGNPRAKFMHCLPAFHNRETTKGEELYAEVRDGGPGGRRGRLRVAGLDRVRPGREPHAHDQGAPRRDARIGSRRTAFGAARGAGP